MTKKNYLLIASLDPLESSAVLEFYHLAINLVALHHEVTLFLVQNGVFPVRSSLHSDALARVAAAGAVVLADEFSLRERGISADEIGSGFKAASIEAALDKLVEGCTAIWH